MGGGEAPIYNIYSLERSEDIKVVVPVKARLKIRLKEHMLASHQTVKDHMLDFNYQFDFENVKILDHKLNFLKSNISEVLHIKEQKHSLNLQTDTLLLDNTYYDFIDHIITLIEKFDAY